MRRPFVAGNWKMNGTRAQTDSLLTGITMGLGDDNTVECGVFPPFVFLEQARQALEGSPVKLGAQTVCERDSGAFTGEVSSAMLAEMGCTYVIVGHSERRTLYGESDQMVAKKFYQATQHNMTPILCVGETLLEHEQGDTLAVISRQVEAILTLPEGINSFQNAVIAYEPVWAIGTGKTATPEQAQEVHAAIRAQLHKQDPATADKVQILYGGSVKADNADALFAMPDIDGGLIGGASLDPEAFVAIVKAAQ